MSWFSRAEVCVRWCIYSHLRCSARCSQVLPSPAHTSGYLRSKSPRTTAVANTWNKEVEISFKSWIFVVHQPVFYRVVWDGSCFVLDTAVSAALAPHQRHSPVCHSCSLGDFWSLSCLFSLSFINWRECLAFMTGFVTPPGHLWQQCSVFTWNYCNQPQKFRV